MNNFFGQNLKALRTQKGVSQAKLSEALMKSYKTIGNRETDYSKPSIDELIKISNFFDISIDEFIKYKIESANFKIAGDQNRKDRNQIGTVLFFICEMKYTLQEEINNRSKSDTETIDWRDTNITFLENQLKEAMNKSVS